MKILNLIIKQVYFDQILAGTKKEEFREVRPTTFKKYLRYTCCGEEFEDIDDIPDEEPYKSELEKDGFDVAVIPYDALRLYVGYNKNRDSMLVEVKDTILEFFVDEKGEPIEYTYTDKKGETTTYLACQMIYQLGKIIEKDIHPKNQK